MSSHESATKQILESKMPQIIGRTMLEHTASDQPSMENPEQAVLDKPLAHIWQVVAALSDYKTRYTGGMRHIPTPSIDRFDKEEYSKNFVVDGVPAAPLSMRTTFWGEDSPELRQVAVTYNHPFRYENLRLDITLSVDRPPLIAKEVWSRGAWHMMPVNDPARQREYIEETVRELDAEIARSGIVI